MKRTQNPYLSIKAFSELTRTPIDTLKYYDRIGLLKPAYVGENKYRYYLPEQSLILTRILFDSRANVPLKDIRNSLNSKTPEEVMAHYEKINCNIQTYIAELYAMQGTISNLRYYYGLSRKHSRKTLFTIYLPEWFMIRSPRLKLDATSESSESDIANQLFLKGFYNGRWPHYLLGACFSIEDVLQKHFEETAYFLKVDHPEQFNQQELNFIRNGHWICMLMDVRGKGLKVVLEEYMQKLQQNQKEIEGDILVMDIINSLLTSNPDEFCTMVYALKKEDHHV